MEQQLKEKLWSYIIENNPELMFNLQEDYSVQRYLDKKIKTILPKIHQWKREKLLSYQIEDKAMLILTRDLKPSKFHYIRDLLESEFEEAYAALKDRGSLTYKIVTLTDFCKEAFEAIGFSEENQNSKRLKYAIRGLISQYLEKGIPDE